MSRQQHVEMVAHTVFTKQTANKQTFMQVLLAKLKADNKFYAVKVLQKKVILKKKEVGAAVILFFYKVLHELSLHTYTNQTSLKL